MCAFGTGRKSKQVMDRQQVWDLYLKHGSVRKVALALYDLGLYNQRTGKPYSDQGIWESTWRYAFEHLVEARKVADENYKADSKLLTNEVWYRLVVQKARYILKGEHFTAFMEKNLYLKPYE
jgi:hypothetical protein